MSRADVDVRLTSGYNNYEQSRTSFAIFVFKIMARPVEAEPQPFTTEGVSAAVTLAPYTINNQELAQY